MKCKFCKTELEQYGTLTIQRKNHVTYRCPKEGCHGIYKDEETKEERHIVVIPSLASETIDFNF